MVSVENLVEKTRKLHLLKTQEDQLVNERGNRQITCQELDDLNRTLDFSMEEYVKFQELKSLAVANGSITLEDGMYIYGILGEAGPMAFNESPIAVKVVFTELFTRWMRERLDIPA